MATIIGDIVAPGGKYLKDGQEKTRWLKCGVLMQTDKGFRIKLESLPVGGGSEQGLWLNVFEKDDKPRPQGSSSNNRQDTKNDGYETDDDIPF